MNKKQICITSCQDFICKTFISFIFLSHIHFPHPRLGCSLKLWTNSWTQHNIVCCDSYQTGTSFCFLGWVSRGPNFWRDPQYPHIWEQQGIWSGRFTPVRLKGLRVVSGCWPIRGGRCCGRRQACETDPREEAYNARWKRTRPANCV